jgi:hypothetical protein
MDAAWMIQSSLSMCPGDDNCGGLPPAVPSTASKPWINWRRLLGRGRSASEPARPNVPVRANAEQGAEFEVEVEAKLQQTQAGVVKQVTVRTESGTRTRVDFAGRDRQTGEVKLTEAKSSEGARLTRNQKAGYPEMEQRGGVVTGKGKPGFPGVAHIPPTRVDVVRPVRNEPKD